MKLKFDAIDLLIAIHAHYAESGLCVDDMDELRTAFAAKFPDGKTIGRWE